MLILHQGINQRNRYKIHKLLVHTDLRWYNLSRLCLIEVVTTFKTTHRDKSHYKTSIIWYYITVSPFFF